MIEVAHPSCEQYQACLQRGGGSVPVYSGTIMQRGYGFGGLFRRLANGLIPLLPSIGKAALGVASDKMSGIPLSRALKTRSLQAGKDMLLRTAAATTNAPRKKRKSVKRRAPISGRRIRKSDVFGSI